MTVEAVDDLEASLASLDIHDGPALKALAQRLEALGDPARATTLCARSNALKRAVGQVRAEALASLLARDERDEFIRLAADATYMSVVDLETLRVPRYVAVEQHACACGLALMVPYPKQGGPGFGVECPACAAPYVAKVAYHGHEYRVVLEADTRPAKKRKRKHGAL